MAENAAIIFDLDGTLFDTVPEMFDSVKVAASKQGISIDTDINEARSYLGDGIRRFVKRAITGQHWGEPDPAVFKSVLEETLRVHEGLVLRRNSLYPGVTGTLESLQQEGWRLGIATNKLERFTIPLLQKFLPSIKFGSVVCGDSLENGKPDPGPLRQAASELGVSPKRCAMVGDSVADVNATHAAGFAIMIVVSYGYHQRTGLKALKADKFIDRMDELPMALEALAVT